MEDLPDNEYDTQIEQALRLGELRKEVMDHVEGPFIEGGVGNMPMEEQLHFWQYVLAFESAEDSTIGERLRDEADFTAMALKDLDGPKQIYDALWQLLYACASIRVFVHFTDHLSDGELYRLMLEEIIPAPTNVPPKELACNCRFNITEFAWGEFSPEASQGIGTDGDAGELTFEEWEEAFAKQFPPRYERDRFLPVPPEEDEARPDVAPPLCP